MADYPLRSATDRCLGGPLPHQLANQTQAHPLPINLWRKSQEVLSHYEVLITVSSGYPSVRGRLPTRYSPVRRFQFFHSTEVSFQNITLDLHVLGTPPAFILSQDQTLKLWYLIDLSIELNLTHKRTLAFRCYCFCFLRNCTLTFKHRLNVLPIIADCILYFESDENRSSHREELNLLFRLNFYTMQFSMFALHLTWNSFILPNQNSFVNNFFQVF